MKYLKKSKQIKYILILTVFLVSLLFFFYLYQNKFLTNNLVRVIVISDDKSINSHELEEYISSKLAIGANIDKEFLDRELIEYNSALIIDKFEIIPFYKLVLAVKKRDVGYIIHAKNGSFTVNNDGYVTGRISYLNGTEDLQKNNLVNDSNIEYYKNLSEGEYTNDPLLIAALSYSKSEYPITVKENRIETYLKLNDKKLLVLMPETNDKANFSNKLLSYLKDHKNLINEEIKEIDLRYSRIVLRS